MVSRSDTAILGGAAMNELLLRRRNKATEKGYFHFADPEVERIVVSHIGDDTGVTLQQIQACTSIGTWFKDNANIVTFDEFKEFTGVKSLQTGAFNNCTSLVSIITPPLTSITYGNDRIFGYDYALNNVVLDCNFVNQAISKSGDGNGLLHIKGNLGTTASYSWATNYIIYKKVIVDGNLTINHGSNVQRCMFGNYSSISEIIIKGDYTNGVSGNIFYSQSSGNKPEFIEIGGVVNGYLTNVTTTNSISRVLASDCIIHLGYNGVAGSVSYIIPSSVVYDRLSKLYVGDGSSAVNDQAVLNQYLADSGWAAYSSKLDLWSNYNGEYKN